MGSACGGASEATVKATAGTPTAKVVEDEVAARDPANPTGFSIAPPAEAPDITALAVKQRRASQALLLLAGRGRRDAFLGQGYGPSALSSGGTTVKGG